MSIECLLGVCVNSLFFFSNFDFDMFQIVKETWVCKRGRVSDYTIYTGALGTAFLLFKAYQVTLDKNDLALCSDIIKACDSASRGSGYTPFAKFHSFSYDLS